MPVVNTESGQGLNLVRTRPRGGAPVVLLHALGLDLSWWDHQIEALGDDHHVIALDLPGHGLSDAMEGPPSFDRMAAAVAGALDRAVAGPVDLVGISFGGMVAQAIAIARPDLVRSLTLVATSCTFSEPVRQVIRERSRVALAGGMAVLAPLHVERWFPPAFRERRPDVLDRAVKVLLRQDPLFHAALWDVVAALDLERSLPAVTCPTLVVAGGEDASAPPAAGQAIVDQIVGAMLYVMPSCGHFPPVEAPEMFNARLKAFLLTA